MTNWQDLYRFWFGNIELTPAYYQKNIHRWFWGDNPELDRVCFETFAPWLDQTHSSWLISPQSIVSLIVLYDQIPRNAFRGTPRAYEYDQKALELCLKHIDGNVERELNPIEKIFFYMPLEHAEDISHQNLCVEKFATLHHDSKEEVREFTRLGWTKAIDHQEVIAKYKRFPHRNAILGRADREEENSYLENFAGEF